MGHARLSGEQIEQRGQEWYAQKIRAEVEADDEGRICVIDVETGEYVIDETMLAASRRLLAKKPGAALWAERIGHDVVYRFGGDLRAGILHARSV